MKVNILLPNVSRSPSGGHKVIYEYCNKLAEDEVDVHIYYFPLCLFKGYHIPEFIRIHLVKLYGKIIGPRKWFKLNDKIVTSVIDKASEMRKSDIIIATSIETAEPVYNLEKQYGKKLYFIQDYENWSFSDDFVIRSYSLGMKNVVVSKWLQTIVDQYSIEKSVLIPNGVDTRIFFDKGKNRNIHSIVFQYRNNKNKGCIYAIDAIKKLKTIYTDLKVNVITSEKEVPQFPEYFICYHNLSPVEVANVNNESQVFICSTIDEGFGLPGLEAMACGCAVCSTDYTGVHEYAVDGYNALLSPIRDPQAMADNVSRLFDDPELRSKIVINGIETGKEKSVDNSYRKFKKMLEETIKE